MITVTIIRAANGRFLTAINERPLVPTPTTNPLFGSCRALVALGYADGPVQFIHAGSATIAARIGSIHGGAKLRVEETDRNGLRIVAYRPFPGLTGRLAPGDSGTPEFDDPAQLLACV